MTYTVGSLFSGIGGLDLGLERAGHKVIWQSEIDPFACKVLKKHWPKVVNHGDIKQIDWATVEPVDIICGGYPCQPFSTAGKRKGTDDPRHLWPWVRTAISELQPQYAILENVRGHLSMGGLQVIGELAEIGYDAEWRVVSAAGVGAPHQRERIIILAYPNSSRWQGSVWTQETCSAFSRFNDTSTTERWREHWFSEPGMGRVANGIPKRMDKLRGLGNAVVPQVAEYIGRLITTS
jgi:DNA (cytosine-5)-methyltransferase 1